MPIPEFINICSETEIHPRVIGHLRIINVGGKALRDPPDPPQHWALEETEIREGETLA